MFPPVHSLAWRRALEDDEICGMRIPSGAIVAIIPWVIHRHKSMWEHAGRFDPQRFSEGLSSERPRHSYIPFSAGPRYCIGASFAMTEGVMILARMVQRYRLELATSSPVEPRGLITLRPRNALLMRPLKR